MTPAEHYPALARALTLDDVFQRAYGTLRVLLRDLAETEPDRQRRAQLYQAMESAAVECERELVRSWKLHDLEAERLAWPE